MEVESLSRRCKFSESSFVQLSSALSVLPLESKGGESSLKAEIKDLEKELSTLKNQDLTVRRLENRIQEMEAQNRINFQSVEIDFRSRLEEADQKYRDQIDTDQVLIQVLNGEKLQQEILLKSSFDEISQLSVQIDNLQSQLIANQAGTLSSTASDLYKEMLEVGELRINELQSQLSDSLHNESLIKTKVASLEKNLSDSSLKYSSRFGESSIEDIFQKLVSQGKLIKEKDIRCIQLQEEIESLHDSTPMPAELTRIEPSNMIEMDESMSSMIQSQRDRMRARVVELEHERDTLKQSQSELGNRLVLISNEKNKLQGERDFWKNQKNNDIESGTPVLGRRREQDIEQHFTSLLVWGLGNSVTRRIGVAYLLTLHLLVFMVLYRLSSIVSNSE